MNVEKVRKDFPWLQHKDDGTPRIYFDNASTTHKPQAVIDEVVDFYTQYNATTHRGVYADAEQATTLYEQVRKDVARFIGVFDSAEVVFTRGTTESINLVAATWGMQNISVGDEVVITELEHHANLVPWQRLCARTGATLKYIPVNHDGTLRYDVLSYVITPRTKLVAVSHSSNVLGVVNDIDLVVKIAKSVGARVLLDAAQTAPRKKLDLQKLGVDFAAFSGHKMMGPTGVGVLYVSKELHETLPPYQVGGGMVYEVDFDSVSWLPMPHRLEAGTPAIAQVIGLGAAIKYLQNNIDFASLERHETKLVTTLLDGIATIDGIVALGSEQELRKSGHLVSFLVEDIHPHDVAAYLSEKGICVRAGHHCAQPLAKRLKVEASVRASFYCYNTVQEVDQLLSCLRTIRTAF